MHMDENGDIWKLPFGDGRWASGYLTEDGDYVKGFSILIDQSNYKKMELKMDGEAIGVGNIISGGSTHNIAISHPPFISMRVHHNSSTFKDIDDEMDNPFYSYKRRLRLIKR